MVSAPSRSWPTQVLHAMCRELRAGRSALQVYGDSNHRSQVNGIAKGPDPPDFIRPTWPSARPAQECGCGGMTPRGGRTLPTHAGSLPLWFAPDWTTWRDLAG